MDKRVNGTGLYVPVPPKNDSVPPGRPPKPKPKRGQTLDMGAPKPALVTVRFPDGRTFETEAKDALRYQRAGATCRVNPSEFWPSRHAKIEHIPAQADDSHADGPMVTVVAADDAAGCAAGHWLVNVNGERRQFRLREAAAVTASGRAVIEDELTERDYRFVRTIQSGHLWTNY